MARSSSRRPSSAVFRRRRIAVFGGLLLLLVAVAWGVWLILSQNDPDAPAPRPSVTSSASPDASATEGAETAEPSPEPTATTPAPIPVCASPEVEVRAVVNAETFGAEQFPELSISLTNNGSRDCRINVGTTTQVLTVTSGNDVWWRSTDCQQSPEDSEVMLTAGQTVVSLEPVVWNRIRSSAETCDSNDRPRAPGGGATYNLTVEIGGLPPSESVQFFLE